MWLQQCDGRDSIDKIQSLPSILLSAVVTILIPLSAVFGQEDYGTWPNSASIFINTTSSGAALSQNVNNFPVLVRLNPSVFKEFSKTLSGGADIRFAKSNGAHLPYEIERWTGTDTAEIWVLVDTVYANSNTQYFRMYWGKSGVTSQSNPQAVFNAANGFAGVWHLGEAGNNNTGNYRDATANANHGTGSSMSTSSRVAGAVGLAQNFNGSSNYITVNDANSLDVTKITVSAWIQATALGGRLIDKSTPNGKDGYNLDTYGSKIRFCTNGTYSGNTTLQTGSWVYVAVTHDGSTARVYRNGSLDGSGTLPAPGTNARSLRIAANPDGGDKFNGVIDEPSVSNVERSAYWIKLSYEMQKPGASCVTIQANTPPSISAHPSDTSVLKGTAAFMRVAASGTSPFTYAWYKNSVAPANKVANQTTNTLSLTNVQMTDSGSYRCVVGNAYGTATSNPGKLSVRDGKPVITVQPKNTEVLANQTWSMSVTATGEPPLLFSWYKSGSTVKLGSNSIYSASAAKTNDAGSYYCVVSNAFGACTSKTATLTVYPNTVEITNPISLRGLFKDNTHVQLTIDRYEDLPTTASGTLFPWFADTVMIWHQTGSFPTYPPSTPANVKMHLSTMKTAPGDTFVTIIPVPAIGNNSYYFKASVKWRNTTVNPPKDSLPPFSGDASGAIVYMSDTSHLANPLSLAFGYTPPESQVKVTIGKLKDPSLRWNLISGAILSYSVSGSSYSPASPLTKERLQEGGDDTCIVIVSDPRFTGTAKTVQWRLVLTGINNNASDTVKGACSVGATPSDNTMTVRVDSVWSTEVKLGWNNSGPAVDSIRIWYGLQEVPDNPVPSVSYSFITLSGKDTIAVLSGLEDSTRFHFGLQIKRSGVWSDIPPAAKTSVTTLSIDPNTVPVNNKVKFVSVAFDPLTNKLQITWKVDTGNLALNAGIVWGTDSGTYQKPSTLPKVGEIVLIPDLSKPMTYSLDVDGSSLAFDKKYFFGIWLQKAGGAWSWPTDSSTFSFSIPKPVIFQVTYFKDKDTMVSVFNGAVTLKKIEEITVNATISYVKLSTVSSGLIPVSAAFRFEQVNPPPTPILLGLRYDSIPPGYTINDIRMYHYDSTQQKWYVDTVPDRHQATQTVSIRIPASNCTFPFLLAIDIQKPVVTVQGDTASAIHPGTEISMKIGVTDNISNPEVRLLAGRADDTLSYKNAISSPVPSDWKIPGGYVEGDCGIRVLLVTNDGRFIDTVNLSRDIRVPDADVVMPKYEKWIPLAASVTLDDIDVRNVLEEFIQPGKQWEYDTMQLRLFTWAGTGWLQYSTQTQNQFSFLPGRVIWLKTRKTDPISLDTGRTISLKRPYTIQLKALSWTDFALPYRFDIRIGDILADTDTTAAQALQFYVWKRNQAGQFFTNPFYLPLNGPPHNDKKSVLEDEKDGERMAYSVFNPMQNDVVLRIPGIPVALSNIPAARAKQTAAGWSIAIRSFARNEELCPVLCAYRAENGRSAAYPLPPSWSKVSVGICDADRKKVYGNVITRELSNGGYFCQLVFENRGEEATGISYTVERLAGGDINIGVLDPESKIVYGTDAPLHVEVGPRGRAYRWLAIGNPGYIEGLSHKLTKGEFALLRIAPNPFRGALRIEYGIPYGGIESVRCELIDQLGRVVWSAAESRNVRPGKNEFVWNPRKSTLAAGAYIVRLTGFDGVGKKKEERLSRVMYLP